MNKYVHEPNYHPLLYADCEDNFSSHDEYFKWAVKLQYLEVVRYRDAAADDYEISASEKIENFTGVALVSLQNTAIVLPPQQLQKVLETINQQYQTNCKVEKSHFYYVVCDNLDKPLSIANIHLKLVIDHLIPLHVNPKELVLDCKQETVTQQLEEEQEEEEEDELEEEEEEKYNQKEEERDRLEREREEREEEEERIQKLKEEQSTEEEEETEEETEVETDEDKHESDEKIQKPKKNQPKNENSGGNNKKKRTD